jgi:hypothetical protein
MCIKDWFKPICSIFLSGLLSKLEFLTAKAPPPSPSVTGQVTPMIIALKKSRSSAATK